MSGSSAAPGGWDEKGDGIGHGQLEWEMGKVLGGGTDSTQLPPGPAAPTSAMCPAPTSEMQLKLRTNESRL